MKPLSRVNTLERYWLGEADICLPVVMSGPPTTSLFTCSFFGEMYRRNFLGSVFKKQGEETLKKIVF